MFKEIKAVAKTFCPDGLPIPSDWLDLLEKMDDKFDKNATPVKR